MPHAITSANSDAVHNDAIVSEILIAAPVDRVFKALTDPAELTRWFRNPECPVKRWEMDARPGGRYGYATEKGTVVEIDPPRLLVYSWIANWHEDKSLRTIVRWELTPDAAGTHVKVTHRGLAGEDAARKDYSGGWPGVMEMLKNFVER
jgi:uncharacterized protein YndB with AHSA1/START domain